ncbi:MAG: hypothetical protein LBR80_07425 [Deltaproteobacteria bacterium]|jgi:hypothetical protein|nr:hypothetical protein [Deltaproteobacteria bacterium]
MDEIIHGHIPKPRTAAKEPPKSSAETIEEQIRTDLELTAETRELLHLYQDKEEGRGIFREQKAEIREQKTEIREQNADKKHLQEQIQDYGRLKHGEIETAWNYILCASLTLFGTLVATNENFPLPIKAPYNLYTGLAIICTAVAIGYIRPALVIFTRVLIRAFKKIIK